MSTSASAVNERLAALTRAGTSIWLDQIRRTLITEGELQRLVDEDSLRGVTSSPAIFEKAILGSSDYDDTLEAGAREGKGTEELYDALAIEDVQLACDVLRSVWDATEHYDGYVSIEVNPTLARRGDETLAEARRLWKAVDRPNVMIKIPGTPEGVTPIEEAIADGININVTLLFSVQAYETVAEAFIRGMERRQAAGTSLDVHSVASFFVSRVDTEVDKRLDKLGHEDLKGRAGLANARAAYQRYKAIFHGERFAALLDAGAPVQRQLWASTGVKNPAYPDTMYVDGLVGPETVNTMPMATLLAAAERAEITGATCDLDPTDDLAALAGAGIDMDDVTDQLLREGIETFETSLDKLIAGIESKRESVVTGRPRTFESNVPDDLEPAIAQRVQRAADEGVARRIWGKDATLWAPEGTPEVANRLGWLTIAETLREQAADLMTWARSLDYDDVALLGMGGSSLGPEVLRRSFGAEHLHVLDSTDAGAVRALRAAIDPARTIFVVSSKSGGTLETLSHFAYFYEEAGRDGSRFVAVTDPGSPLQKLAEEHGFARVFGNDPDIGGRYSVLSYFGLVPAALAGIDLEPLLDGAATAESACHSFDASSNSGLWLGCALGELALAGRDKLTFVVDEPISSFGVWVEQLVAESTGKQGRGMLPVADEPLGAVEAYGDDRVFVHLRNADDPDKGAEAALTELAKAGHPLITLRADGPQDLGRIFFFAEFATAVAGWVLGINPFDQPNVQEAKDNTKRVLDEGGARADSGSLEDVLAQAAPPHYVAIMGYVQPSEEFDAKVAKVRAALRNRTRATTTFGYGPRFLHSTGQLHKGGPNSGVFVQLVSDPAEDLPIPG
ncbi:MAG: transaldolase / glucose-6-phosphate isomerase, partial [Solirubrobacteraceae bacterium]|nr:transaldolase / glucose-6-phosphate isomerase [Solirubrobacteraceae bacterium]